MQTLKKLSVYVVLSCLCAFALPGIVLPAAGQQASSSRGSNDAAEDLPDSPGATLAKMDAPEQQGSTSSTSSAPNAQQTGSATNSSAQTPAQKPVGTAAAEAPDTTGIAASQPAGAAIAPAKQRRVRTIVIKVGAIVAAAAAVGTVVALSEATGSKPPGAH